MMASRLLCLAVLLVAGPASVEAARTVRHQLASEGMLESVKTGNPFTITKIKTDRTSCNDMYATIRFPSIEIQFSILKQGARGEEHTVSCGPTAANPEEEVTFNCTDFQGELAWAYKSGDCRSEDVAPGSSVTCPAVEFEATWTVEGRSVPMLFAMKETSNPDGVDLPVEVMCPEDTPGTGKTISFTCTKSGQWDFDGGKKTVICASEGDVVLQQESSEELTEVHEVIAGSLPCALDTEDTELKQGGKGFTLLVKCEKPISDGVIQVDGVDQWSFNINDHTKKSRLVTLSDEYFGKELTIQAKSEGVLGSLSIRPKPAAELGPLPCELGTRPTQLTSGAKGFQVTINCKKPITKGVLILPGLLDKTLPDPLSGFQVVYTQSEALFKGKTLTVRGFSNGVKGVTDGVTI